MKKYVKKLIPIEAVQMNEEFEVKTLEGTMKGKPGDYLVTGIKGEQYPCDKQIFEENYEEFVPCKPQIIEMVRLTSPLITSKYTYVEHEKDYLFNAPHLFKVKSEVHTGDEKEDLLCIVHFQEGPIKECGVNGVCNEDLIAMVIRRLEGFQNSEFKCKENEMALDKLKESLMWLRVRTTAREMRNVEGTHNV